MYTYIHACINVCMHVCMYVCTYVRMYVHVYTCMHTYMHAHMHTYIHTCIHVYTHTCIHTHTHPRLRYDVASEIRRTLVPAGLHGLIECFHVQGFNKRSKGGKASRLNRKARRAQDRDGTAASAGACLPILFRPSLVGWPVSSL